ncbi:conserved hypothetical protein [Candidatus Desulfosporosinus infrequens]|uniref:Uncharacterized protein n=1 Tax=Candidatus Desulfosporosinus infrequens TaxID=2043169 RepID=A0A2U3JXA5_9FIRM|nr:conserved hypothetical protein [Candidatus Desulfosporosinus infrequens]
MLDRTNGPQGVPGNGYAFTIEKEVAKSARLLFGMAPLSMGGVIF